MKNILNETESLAYSYLKAFGFKDEQIEPLIRKGKKELEQELYKLKSLLDVEELSFLHIDDSLHAIKGLLFHLGHNKLAMTLDDARLDIDNKKNLIEIKNLLGLS